MAHSHFFTRFRCDSFTSQWFLLTFNLFLVNSQWWALPSRLLATAQQQYQTLVIQHLFISITSFFLSPLRYDKFMQRPSKYLTSAPVYILAETQARSIVNIIIVVSFIHFALIYKICLSVSAFVLLVPSSLVWLSL